MKTKFRVRNKKEDNYFPPMSIILAMDGNAYLVTSRQGDGEAVLRGPLLKEIYEIEFYLGFKDKNGKEIYEGDILEIERLYIENQDVLNIQGKIYYDVNNASFRFESTLGITFSFDVIDFNILKIID